MPRTRCCAWSSTASARADPDRRARGSATASVGLPLRHPPPGRERDGVLRCLSTSALRHLVAITGSLPRKADNPAVPITVAEQVESTQAAMEAGATIVHCHVRNDDETPDLGPGAVRAPARGPAPALPGPHRAVLDRRPLRRRPRARRHAAAQARHGLALGRLQQLPDPGLRELPGPGRLAGRRDADAMASSRRSRRSTSRHIFQAVGMAEAGRLAAPALRPVRDGGEERDAGRPRDLRLLRRHAQAPRARRDWPGRGSARTRSRSTLVAGARRPLPAPGSRTTCASTATGSRPPTPRWSSGWSGSARNTAGGRRRSPRRAPCSPSGRGGEPMNPILWQPRPEAAAGPRSPRSPASAASKGRRRSSSSGSGRSRIRRRSGRRCGISAGSEPAGPPIGC